MLKNPVKRILLAAATAASLAAVVAPQAASAAEVRCGGRSSCETPYLQASSSLRFAVSARGVQNVPVHGSFELIRDAGNGHGVRIFAGRFFRSATGHAAGRPGRYKLRVSSLAATRVEGHLWTP